MNKYLKTNRIPAILASGAAIFATSQADAVILAQYGFTGGSLASSDADLLSTASDITSGAGATRVTGTTAGGNGYLDIRSNVPTTNLAQAVTNDVSFSFTVTPVVGETVSFDNLTLLARRSANSSTRGFRLYSSVTGTTILAENAALLPYRTNNPEFENSGFAFTLNNFPALQNVNGPVTFTMYVNPGSTGTDARAVDFDNITLDSVPEPSSVLLGGIGLIALFRRRRD